MSRNNIFEILVQNDNLEKEVDRIDILFSKCNLLCVNNYLAYTLKKYINDYCFATWANRRHCLDLEDFLDVIDYDDIMESAYESPEALFTFIEVIFNFWKMAECSLKKEDSKAKCSQNFYRLYDIMTECLSHYNQTIWYDEKTERVIVVEDKPEVTAVAEIVEPDLAMSIVRYNHRSLKGDIKAKKSILLELGTELEPQRKALAAMNKELEDDIFFMLNNMDLRHNNRSQGDKNYKAVVAGMSDSDIEGWYDELYQMMLLAFLELDQANRNTKVEALKVKIAGGTT